MAENSSIEWTDATWNPVVGCTKVSPGCAHCYAETMGKRLRAMALADIEAGRDPGRKRAYIDAINEHGHWSGQLIPQPDALAEPLKWKKPRMVFVNSMSDLFHESLSDQFIDGVFAVMNATLHQLPIGPNSGRWHTYQVLTKRADRMAEYIASRSTRSYEHGEHPIFEAGRGKKGLLCGHGMEVMNAGACLTWPLPNVWLGVSVENRAQLQRIEALRRTPAAIRFLSLEPLLEDLGTIDLTGIHWVIVGGESGPNARPIHPDWVRSLRDQCLAAGVAFFFKQWGEWKPISEMTEAEWQPYYVSNRKARPGQRQSDVDDLYGRRCTIPTSSIRFDGKHGNGPMMFEVIDGHYGYQTFRVGKKAAGRSVDGQEWNQFPSVKAVS